MGCLQGHPTGVWQLLWEWCWASYSFALWWAHLSLSLGGSGRRRCALTIPSFKIAECSDNMCRQSAAPDICRATARHKRKFGSLSWDLNLFCGLQVARKNANHLGTSHDFSRRDAIALSGATATGGARGGFASGQLPSMRNKVGKHSVDAGVQQRTLL